MLGGTSPPQSVPPQTTLIQQGWLDGASSVVAVTSSGRLPPKQGLRVVSTTLGMACALGRVGLGWVGLDWAGRRWVGASKRLAWIGVLGGGRVGRCWVLCMSELRRQTADIRSLPPEKTRVWAIPDAVALSACFWFIEYEQELGVTFDVLGGVS